MAMKTDHHVHFGEEADVLPKDNDIVLQPGGLGAIAIHLGFVQIGHRYHVTFTLPQSMYPTCILQPGQSMEFGESPMANPNCHLLSMTMNENGLLITVEFFAHKEKLLKEELSLVEADESSPGLKLTFNARVLGRGKGTPLLRNGIRCVNVELEDESEASDWQGFD